MKMLRVDDDVHEIIRELAKKDERNLTPYLNRHFRKLGANTTGRPEDYNDYDDTGIDPDDTDLL